jgi:hypothetical protein
MDADTIFKRYLLTWPDVWIVWPKNDTKMKEFFAEGSTKALFDDLLDFIKEEQIGSPHEPGFHSMSEWLVKYFKTVRGKALAKKELCFHEPLLIVSWCLAPPIKELMNGFIVYAITTEMKP